MSSHEQLSRKLEAMRRIGDDLPAVVIIHNLQTQSVEYMSPAGQKRLNTTLEELKAMGPEYFTRFFNPQESAEYVPKILGMLQTTSKTGLCLSFSRCALRPRKAGAGTSAPPPFTSAMRKAGPPT